jgi:hypothetical protein
MAEGYSIDDPRPLAAEAPYTFFLPTDAGLAALAPGDMAKLIIRAVPQSGQWDAERLWVLIEAIEGDRLHGSLQNEPYDIPALKAGDRVEFERWQIASIYWDEARPAEPEGAHPREYWERCLVDWCMIEERLQAHYLYREAPEPPAEGDRFPDSGWRIRGDYRGLSDSKIDARETRFVALGAVLNVDDSWLSLIDAPVGSAFIRDWDTGGFVPYR